MIFDKSVPFEERSRAIYELTLVKKTARQQARKALLQIALDPTETVAIRHTALCRLSCLFSKRSTYSLLPLLLDTNAPWELRAEAAHVLGMASEHRPFAIRALKSAWKTAPPRVRVYIAYALAGNGGQQAIPLLRESINEFTSAHDLPWTLAQECRWAITCCRNATREGASDPEDPAFLSPTWEQETQYFRAKGRRVWPRSCR